MPADRARRDAAADALTSFLRCEIDRDALGDRLRQMAKPSVEDRFLESLEFRLCLEGKFRLVISEEVWERLWRDLAFLRTDLEERPPPVLCFDKDDRPGEIRLARWHIAGLMIAAAVAYFTSWWVLVAANVISYLQYQYSMRSNEPQVDEEYEARLAFLPFANKDEWLKHKHLVDELHLPVYDPLRFDEPAPKEWPVLSAIVGWTCLLLILPLLLYALLFSIAFWPVWLVAMSLSRK